MKENRLIQIATEDFSCTLLKKLIQCLPVLQPQIRLLGNGDSPSPGFVRRPRPIWPEFAIQMTWFSRMEFQEDGHEGQVYVWILRTENDTYEGIVRRKRFCNTYRGHVIVRGSNGNA